MPRVFSALFRRVDPFIMCLLLTIVLASFLPARGAAASGVGGLQTVAVALLFFLYGARLSPREALEGLRQWRLHGIVFAVTFALFPLLGVLVRVLEPGLLGPQLYQGVLFLCLLPSTVQSSIAFTSIARGNVAAAICSATFSNLIGILATPLLAALLLNVTKSGADFAGQVLDIVLKLLVPFIGGQLARPWIAGWIRRHKRMTTLVDRGSILIVVYGAFSEGVVGGIWGQLTPPRLVGLLLVNALLLAAVLAATSYGSRRMGFAKADRIAIIFCGSKKSLATGVPMASVLFAGPMVGLMVLPLMLFHQMQLMVCAGLARRWAAKADVDHAAVIS
ncbi:MULTISPECIES: bile acid:sodium symporter family protein [Arthrobacter]|uniref:Bile acid:sodium symporter n=1 Tax=Arthrobacter terricola TaxID=2547396 RepID=A0A4R5KBJ2_9MICC|nr:MULTISPECIES: bile acid:sodium symporter family protein [Arthrobacter]MBT8162239.1 bile acid:sodium symporter [Arthrobacter sp. GN70]TDF92282.1 bile acid:sodium symporter [Arthrobacter terricola]